MSYPAIQLREQSRHDKAHSILFNKSRLKKNKEYALNLNFNLEEKKAQTSKRVLALVMDLDNRGAEQKRKSHIT